jgi:hypothetical protein
MDVRVSVNNKCAVMASVTRGLAVVDGHVIGCKLCQIWDYAQICNSCIIHTSFVGGLHTTGPVGESRAAQQLQV